MTRTAVVTGSASAIGKATKSLLEARGERVIGVDAHDADIRADLSTAEGRRSLVEGVRLRAEGTIDAVHAVAGLSQPAAVTAAVNHFATVATLEGCAPGVRRPRPPHLQLEQAGAVALGPAAGGQRRMGRCVHPAERRRSRHRRHADVRTLHRDGRGGCGAPRTHADAVERHRPARRRRRAAGVVGGEANTHLCGQIIYIDGGSDVAMRADAVS